MSNSSRYKQHSNGRASLGDRRHSRGHKLVTLIARRLSSQETSTKSKEEPQHDKPDESLSPGRNGKSNKLTERCGSKTKLIKLVSSSTSRTRLVLTGRSENKSAINKKELGHNEFKQQQITNRPKLSDVKSAKIKSSNEKVHEENRNSNKNIIFKNEPLSDILSINGSPKREINFKELSSSFGPKVTKKLMAMNEQELIELLAADVVNKSGNQERNNNKQDHSRDDDSDYDENENEKKKNFEKYDATNNELCLLANQVPQVRAIRKQYETLKANVSELASLNYAREPEFVRDRLRLRELIGELDSLKINITNRRLMPILNSIDGIRNNLAKTARYHEEESEKVAHDFLDSTIGLDDFLQQYVDIRKGAIMNRAKVDKISKEYAGLMVNVPSLEPGLTSSYCPKPAQRQRRKIK